jgi:hypothetical protein
MAITQTGSNGLFTRLGKLFKIVERVQTHQTDGSAGLAAEIEDVLDEYNVADMKYADDFVDKTVYWQLNAANVYTAISLIAKQTVIGMANDDTTLNKPTLLNALNELIDQMGTSYDVKGNVFGITGDDDGGQAMSSGTGNGKYITSLLNNKGVALQNLRVDKSKLVCIKDAQVAGTAGRETFVSIGEASQVDIRHADFPGGYGQNNVISVSDPSYSNQSAIGRNSLNNSDFEDFSTTNTPDKWTIVTGSVGSNILEEGTIVHRGDKSLQILGDIPGTLTHISQSFNTAGQSTVKLRPETRYCVSFWTHRESAASSGVIRFSVKDGSANILDSSNAALAVTVSGDSADTWVHHSFTFSSPAVLPASAAFHIELTTAIPSTSNVYVDGVQLFRMGNLAGSSSPYIAIIPGSTDFIVDDEASLSVTQSTTGKMQSFCNQFLGLESLGLQLPFQTDGSETAADSLIA